MTKETGQTLEMILKQYPPQKEVFERVANGELVTFTRYVSRNEEDVILYASPKKPEEVQSVEV